MRYALAIILALGGVLHAQELPPPPPPPVATYDFAIFRVGQPTTETPVWSRVGVRPVDLICSPTKYPTPPSPLVIRPNDSIGLAFTNPDNQTGECYYPIGNKEMSCTAAPCPSYIAYAATVSAEKDSAGWVPASPPIGTDFATVPVLTPSEAGSRVPPFTELIDDKLAVWKMAPDNRTVLRDNQSPYQNWTAGQIAWCGGSIRIQGMDLNWWTWTGSNWLMGDKVDPCVTPPAPINCSMSDWTDWGTWTTWSPPNALPGSTQTRTQTHTRQVLIEAMYGGTACPTDLSEINTETRTVPQVDPAMCVAPFGSFVISAVVTGYDETTKVHGSKMRLNYQLASNSPIIELQVKVDGVTVKTQGGLNGAVPPNLDLTADGGMWFATPDIGTHKLSLWTRNAYGCTKESPAPTTLPVRK